MHSFAPAASLAAALLVAASASAGEPPASPSPSTPAPAAPPAAAPPADVMAPPAAAPPPPGPGYYAPPYAVYAAPGPGAPPPYWMGTPVVTERRSNTMRTTGIVLLSVGGLVSVTGATFFGIGVSCLSSDITTVTDPAPAPAPASAGGQGGQERIGTARQALSTCRTIPSIPAGFGLFVGGLVTAVVGIPLLVIGSKQVPVGPAKGMVLPAVSVGVGNASLRWTF